MKKLTAQNTAADYGNDAAHRGESRESNPYPSNHFLHKHWDLGWLEYHPDDFGIEKETEE